jgi:hypothetical protein
MHNSGYTETEIMEAWTALALLVCRMLLATTLMAHVAAVEMRFKELAYFDSLMAALAKETQAIVVRRDAMISKHVDTES